MAIYFSCDVMQIVHICITYALPKITYIFMPRVVSKICPIYLDSQVLGIRLVAGQVFFYNPDVSLSTDYIL